MRQAVIPRHGPPDVFEIRESAAPVPDQGQVRIVLARAQGSTTISVTDTGIGISADDQAHLFQEFGRVGSEDSRRREGTGLGLRLSHKLAGLLGGQIAVQSEAGRGSTFTVSILDT